MNKGRRTLVDRQKIFTCRLVWGEFRQVCDKVEACQAMLDLKASCRALSAIACSYPYFLFAANHRPNRPQLSLSDLVAQSAGRGGWTRAELHHGSILQYASVYTISHAVRTSGEAIEDPLKLEFLSSFRCKC